MESRASPVVADLTGNLCFLLQDSFWAQDMWGFSTTGEGLAVFPVCKMASIHAVQIQNQGGHGPTSASDLIFLMLCGEKEDCSICPNKQVVFGVCICTQSGRERYVWCTNTLVLAMQL